MMSKTCVVPVPVVPAAIVSSAVAPTPARSPLAATVAGEASRGRQLFARRAPRLSTGPVPAVFIVLVWMALWAWVSLGVAAPLSRLGTQERAPAVQQSALRT